MYIHIVNICIYMYISNSTNKFYDPWEPNQRKWLSHVKLWPVGSIQIRKVMNVAQHKTISIFKTLCTGQSFVSLRWARVILEEGPSVEEMPSLVWPVGKSGGGYFLNDFCWRAQHTVGSAPLGQVVLGGIGSWKWTWQLAVPSLPVWPVLQFLPPSFPALTSYFELLQ